MRKLNVNTVGANCIRPHFEEMTLKKEKGITLIALIITIIVMLILVGVTINVALNGGLFEKADNASKQMQIEAEKEELLSAIMGAIGNDGKINFGAIELPEVWDVVSERTYKSPKGNSYTVDENGKIIEGEKEELQNPVAGTYYSPDGYPNFYALILNGDGTISAHPDAGYPEGITYTYTDSIVTGSNGLAFDFYDFGNNKILINESLNYFLALNRNGLEAKELDGTYSDGENNTLKINDDEGKIELTIGDGGYRMKKYFYYNNKFYTGAGEVFGTYNSGTNKLSITIEEQEFTFSIQ